MADNFAQSVKQQADIVRIVGEYVRLTKAGAQSYKGLCPFHGEKTPSFNVHATQGFFHCFGCGQSGDVFTFVMKMESVSFPEAVRAVAQKAGIPLPKKELSSPEEAREGRLRGKLLELNEAAAMFFQEQLKSPEAARAREYLTGRGVTAETIAQFRIGYAPESFNALRDKLQGMADGEALRASGLFSFKEQEDGSAGQLYSKFRKRITFPIRNEAGRVIAFTARALESGEQAGPKYMNSPETPLYTKGAVLFNLDKAKQAIRQNDFAVLVEGQMDCISVFMAGIPNVLATSGTAFTEAQVRLLGRFTRRVIVNFDPDTAGANAAEKSLAMLTEEGFEVKIVSLDGGLDPDGFVRERGVQVYMEALRGAKPHSDYLIERARALFPQRTADAKVKAVNFLLPHIQRMPSRIARDEFAADAAQKLGIDSALLRQELRQAAVQRKDGVRVQAGRAPSLSTVEKLLLRALCNPVENAASARVRERLRADSALFEGLAMAGVMASLVEAEGGNPLEAVAEGPERALLAGLLMGEGEAVSAENVEEALHTLHRGRLERRQAELRTEMAKAQRQENAEELTRLMREKQEIDRKLREH